jgi:predicted ATPase
MIECVGPMPPATHSPHADPLTLAGRTPELSLLREHLAATLNGQGRLVLLGGEEGIGKTTLSARLCCDAREQGGMALIGHCYDSQVGATPCHTGTAYRAGPRPIDPLSKPRPYPNDALPRSTP